MPRRAQLHAQEGGLRISRGPIVFYIYTGYTGTSGHRLLEWTNAPMAVMEDLGARLVLSEGWITPSLARHSTRTITNCGENW